MVSGFQGRWSITYTILKVILFATVPRKLQQKCPPNRLAFTRIHTILLLFRMQTLRRAPEIRIIIIISTNIICQRTTIKSLHNRSPPPPPPSSLTMPPMTNHSAQIHSQCPIYFTFATWQNSTPANQHGRGECHWTRISGGDR